MNSRKLGISVFGGLSALVGIVAVVAQTGALQPGEGGEVTITATATRLAGSPGIDAGLGDPAGKGQSFSQDDALRRLSTLAEERLSATVAVEDPRSGSQPVQVNGRPIRLEDLSLREFKRVENTTSVVSIGETMSGFPEPRTVWMATWERTDVFIEEWTVTGTVRVEFVMEDGTGTVLSAGVSKFNPHATVEPQR